MRYRNAIVWVGGVVLALGCDKKPDPPEKVLKMSVISRPTTQELVDTPPTTLSLIGAGIPATLRVPKGWKIVTGDKGVRWIEGYTPHDIAEMKFIPLKAIKPEQRTAMIEDVTKSMAANPATASIPAIRTVGDATIIEDVDFNALHATTEPTTGPTTEPTAAAIMADPRIEWTVTLCIPNHDMFSTYQVRMVGMTRSQFDKDGEFLQKIMGSFTYAP